MTEKARLYSGGKAVSSINGAGKVGPLHSKQSNWKSFSHHKEIHSKWIKDLNIRPETIKLLQENMGSMLSDILAKLLDVSSGKGNKAKTSKQGCIKLKGFCRVKGTVNRKKNWLYETPTVAKQKLYKFSVYSVIHEMFTAVSLVNIHYFIYIKIKNIERIFFLVRKEKVQFTNWTKGDICKWCIQYWLICKICTELLQLYTKQTIQLKNRGTEETFFHRR